MQIRYSYFREGQRRAIFGKEIPDELLAKAFLQILFGNLFDGMLRNVTSDTRKTIVFGRKTISQFSFEEAKEIFERLKKGEKARQIFESKFEEKGMQLPRSEQELDAF